MQYIAIVIRLMYTVVKVQAPESLTIVVFYKRAIKFKCQTESSIDSLVLILMST